MGYSLDAYFFYGLPLEQTYRESDNYDEDLDELQSTWFDIELESVHPAPPHRDYTHPDWKNYWEWRKEYTESYPLENVTLGHTDWTYGAIAVRSTIQRTVEHYSARITLPRFDPVWDEQIKEWCEKYGFEYKEPGWYISALYW